MGAFRSVYIILPQKTLKVPMCISESDGVTCLFLHPSLGHKNVIKGLAETNDHSPLLEGRDDISFL